MERFVSQAILIVGAGPTGLVLALRLRRHGVPFRIIDQHEGPGRASRALVVHARTLEFYDQLGLSERLIEAGTRVETVRLREAGTEVGTIPLRDMGAGLSPFPFALCLPQDEHEAILVEALAAEGVSVEWGTRLDRIGPAADEIRVTLVRGDREERAGFDFVAGCDGAHSRVREAIGAHFGGGTYDRLYYVADVKPLRTLDPDLVVALDKGDFGLRLPSRRGENERLIGYVPVGCEADPKFEDVQADVEQLLGVEVAEVNWFSTYRVHHRVASRFRDGRCFLLGDAGHLHSPVGGQGMNTGIGDAVNLAWKLAAVVSGQASPDLLGSYEPERIAFARSLVATTDRAFQVISDQGLRGRVFRTWIMPRLLPAVTHFDAGRHAMFRLLSQIRVAYPDSPLSAGKAGAVAGGDRLPWVPGADNFVPLARLEWQLHCFGELAAPLAETADALGLPVRLFPWSAEAEHAGFRHDTAYLIRPDGYVARAAPGPAALRAFAARYGLQFDQSRDAPNAGA